MANEKSTNDKPHDDALAALHGLGENTAKPDPSAPDEHSDEEQVYEVDSPPPAAAESEPSPSASGFVSMLSKSNTPQDDPSPSRPNNPPPQSSRPTPQPSSEAQSAPSSPPAQGTYEIRMAREVTMPPSAATLAPARQAPRANPRGRKVPGWYHVAVPIMFTLSSLLMIIGFWALGAIAYIFMAAPKMAEDISYPLVSWDPNIGEYGAISSGSKLMAFAMVIALPVAISLIVMATIMRRQVAKAAEAAARRA